MSSSHQRKGRVVLSDVSCCVVFGFLLFVYLAYKYRYGEREVVSFVTAVSNNTHGDTRTREKKKVQRVFLISTFD